MYNIGLEAVTNLLTLDKDNDQHYSTNMILDHQSYVINTHLSQSQPYHVVKHTEMLNV